jgi:hypothetical protein
MIKMELRVKPMMKATETKLLQEEIEQQAEDNLQLTPLAERVLLATNLPRRVSQLARRVAERAPHPRTSRRTNPNRRAARWVAEDAEEYL